MQVIGSDIDRHPAPASGFNSLAFVSGLGHLGLGNVDWMILFALLTGSIPGIALGSRLTGTLPDWMLRLVLSAVLLYAAYLLGPFLFALLKTS